MEVFVARHPIFDGRKKVHAYELAFRSGFESYYEALDACESDVDLSGIVNFDELTDGRKGFVDFTRNLLIKNFPTLLPKDLVTVGIPQDVEPSDEVVAACRNLKRSGYAVAVDHFGPEDGDNPLMEFADVVKVDFVRQSAEECRTICQKLDAKGVRTLAKKVETPDQFDQALAWGYSLFQGDFFCKPTDRPDKDIPSNQLTYLKVLKEVNRPELSYDELEGLVKQDVGMTYKLLQFINSAWFGLRHEIDSIRRALVLLGPKEIKLWVSLLVVRDMGKDKPHELLVRSLTRARLAELTAPLVGMAELASELFLMGMFSVIDALLDTPMEKVLEQLPLTKGIKGALLGEEGWFRIVYDAILSYEEGEWHTFANHAEALQLQEEAMPKLFREAVKWAGNALGA